MRVAPALIRPAFYRDHLAALDEANNALLSLAVASRLGASQLHELHPLLRTHYLPEVFPAVADIERANWKVAIAERQFGSSERHLAYLGVFFTLSVHQDFLIGSVRLLQERGLDPQNGDPDRIKLSEFYGYLKNCTGASFDKGDLAVFNFFRRTRNLVAHQGGRAGDSAEWFRNIPRNRKQYWLDFGGSMPRYFAAATVLEMDMVDVLVCLGVSRRLAVGVLHALMRTIPAHHWAEIVALDYYTTTLAARRALKVSARGPSVVSPEFKRSVVGFATQFYPGLRLSQRDLSRDVVRAIAVRAAALR